MSEYVKELQMHIRDREYKIENLKKELDQYKSGNLPTWKNEYDIIKSVCDSLDINNQELLSENLKLKTLLNNPRVEDWYLKVENLRKENDRLKNYVIRGFEVMIEELKKENAILREALGY